MKKKLLLGLISLLPLCAAGAGFYLWQENNHSATNMADAGRTENVSDQSNVSPISPLREENVKIGANYFVSTIVPSCMGEQSGNWLDLGCAANSVGKFEKIHFTNMLEHHQLHYFQFDCDGDDECYLPPDVISRLAPADLYRRGMIASADTPVYEKPTEDSSYDLRDKGELVLVGKPQGDWCQIFDPVNAKTWAQCKNFIFDEGVISSELNLSNYRELTGRTPASRGDDFSGREHIALDFIDDTLLKSAGPYEAFFREEKKSAQENLDAQAAEQERQEEEAAEEARKERELQDAREAKYAKLSGAALAAEKEKDDELDMDNQMCAGFADDVNPVVRVERLVKIPKN